MTTAVETIIQDRLRGAGRIVGRHITPGTANQLGELMVASGKGTARAFGARSGTLARSFAAAAVKDVRTGGASAAEADAVSSAFAAMGQRTTGDDLALFAGAVKETARARRAEFAAAAEAERPIRA